MVSRAVAARRGRGSLGRVPAAIAPGAATAERALRGTAPPADAHPAGNNTYPVARVPERLDAAARRGRSTPARLPGEIVAEEGAGPDDARDRGRPQRRPWLAIDGWCN